ncbi:MAG: GIY-YIG nuclease family protein [Bacteroidota bacterium]
MFFVYVLSSTSQKRFYIGMTSDLSRRLKEHNAGKTKSTKGYRPWKILFHEPYPTRVEARKREKYLKSGVGREYINRIWSRSSAGYLPSGRQGATEDEE